MPLRRENRDVNVAKSVTIASTSEAKASSEVEKSWSLPDAHKHRRHRDKSVGRSPTRFIKINERMETSANSLCDRRFRRPSDAPHKASVKASCSRVPGWQKRCRVIMETSPRHLLSPDCIDRAADAQVKERRSTKCRHHSPSPANGRARTSAYEGFSDHSRRKYGEILALQSARTQPRDHYRRWRVKTSTRSKGGLSFHGIPQLPSSRKRLSTLGKMLHA